MINGNKGEWSEIYTLIKLLTDGKLYAADENLEKIRDVFYPIIKVLRNETGKREVYYQVKHENDKDIEIRDELLDGSIMITVENQDEKILIPISEFKKYSELLLEKIKNSRGSSFFIEEVEGFLKDIKCNKLKAPSKDKTDIQMVVHDLNTGMSPSLGFSIKSMMGNPSTLLNTSNATNFIYEIVGTKLNKNQIEVINAIDTKRKVRDRLKLIFEYGGDIRYFDLENVVFKSNLQMIDSNLPIILAEMVKLYYCGTSSDTIDLLATLNQKNPCCFSKETEHPFYQYKIKNLYTDIALGMTPTTVWKGRYDATGGYIIVKESGEVVCYHIYNRNEFQEYLVKNTRFDTPSVTKHRFANVFEHNGKAFIKLNFQIRFKG
ncbi:MAG: HpaII family restriction endonuclease [Desulfitobacteriaceae bacterium]